jgi:hypothetical protein
MPPLPPMDEVIDLLKTVVGPSAGAAGATMLFMWLFIGGKLALVGGPALSIVAGMAAGNHFRNVFPWLPEGSEWHYLLAATGVAVAVETLSQGISVIPIVGRFIGIVLRVATTVAITYFLFPADLYQNSKEPMMHVILGEGIEFDLPRIALPVLFGLTILGNWLFLVKFSEWVTSWIGSFGLAILLGGGAAMVLLHAHSARFTDAATMLASSMLGVSFFSMMVRTSLSAVGAAVAVFFPSLLITAKNETFSNVPTASFLLLGIAPLILVLTYLPPFSGWSIKRPRLITLLLLAIPITIAVALAMKYEELSF